MPHEETKLNSIAAQSREALLIELEKLADHHANRRPVLTLVRLATDPERAKMLFDALQTEYFGDPEESHGDRPDWYAWDTLLYAVNDFAVMAQVGPEEKETGDRIEDQRVHLTLCALSGQMNDWIGFAKEELKSPTGKAKGKLEAALEAINEIGDAPLVEGGLLDHDGICRLRADIQQAVGDDTVA